MNTQPNEIGALKFVRVLGCLFVCFSALLVYGYYLSFSIQDYPEWFRYFDIAMTLFYLSGGIGLLTRNLIGYYLLKVFFYILLLGFPIGTILALKGLRYMRQRNLRKLFTPS